MSVRLLLPLLIALALQFASPASESVTPHRVRAALARSTDFLSSIATEGGFLWRYSLDLQDRRGEEKATASQIWIQPPGTPAVGMAFLEAHAATRDARHLAAAARSAQALVRGQLESGGWDYKVDFDLKSRSKWAYRADGKRNRPDNARNTTFFDDNNTQSALQFLIAYIAVATNEPASVLKPVQNSLDYGLAKMIEAQYPNGAWPQRYDGVPHDPRKFPIRPATIPNAWPREWSKADYGAYYTLNDQAQHDCIRTMLAAWKHFGNRKYLESAREGGKFLVLAQLPEPQPGWAQQYNFSMEPAWARAFEPPAVSTGESVGAMRMLMDLYIETGDAKFLKPLPSAVAWLKRSEIKPGVWARLYELGSNKPLYGDRDGKVHYTLSEISAERRSGYSWQGGYGIESAINQYEKVRARSREFLLEEREKNRRANKPADQKVASVLAEQDDQGRWVRSGRIETSIFIRNISVLSQYLLARD